MGDRFLVLGSFGQLGCAFKEHLSRGHEKHSFLSREELDITDTDALKVCLRQIKPTVVINCSAYNEVDAAENNSDDAFAVNTTAVMRLAENCKKQGIFLVHYSTDYVFDGTKTTAYTEDDVPCPINQYGKSKLEGERALQGNLRDHLLFRVSWVFGKGKRNFLFKAAKWAKTQNEVKIATDEVSIPTYADDIVEATLLAYKKGLVGLYHLTNTGYCSRYDWVKFFFEKKGFDNKMLPAFSKDFGLPAKRPGFSAMSNAKACGDLKKEMPSWQDAVERFLQEHLKRTET